jgi:hypothetical protein
MLLVLLLPIALIGLAIVAMHLFSKPVDKSLAVADDAPKRYRENLQGEVDGAALYRTLADVEADEKLAEVYRRLAAVEDAHAEYWRGELVAATPVSRASSRASGRAHSAGSPAASGPPSCCRPSTRSNRRTAAPCPRTSAATKA